MGEGKEEGGILGSFEVFWEKRKGVEARKVSSMRRGRRRGEKLVRVRFDVWRV